MALYKLHDFDPSYRDSFDGDDIKGLDVYAQGNDDKIGKIHDALVDEDGTFRYLIVDTGFWVFGKKVLLPIGQARIDHSSKRVYAKLTKEQVETLPEFTDELKLDNQYEDEVRGVYRPSTVVGTDASLASGTGMGAGTAFASPSLGSETYTNPLGTTPVDTAAAGALVDEPGYVSDPAYAATDRSATYNDTYDREPELFGINDTDHQNIRLYQERLLANKQRQRTGNVTVGKHVETETQRVAVPLEKERVVIERTNVGDTRAVTPGTDAFHDGEVARVEVYEETADIQKEAFVREEVSVRKEIDRETVEAEETLRREELDVNTDGNPVIDNSPRSDRRPR